MTGTVQKALNTIPNVDVDGVGGHYSLAEMLAVDGNGNPQQLACNQNLTLLTSGTRTATTSTAISTNINARGVAVFLRVSAASGTGGLKVAIIASDPVSGQGQAVFVATTAITAAGIYAFYLYPGIGAGIGNQSLSAFLPAIWQGQVQHSDGSNYTYSLGASLIL